MPDTTTRMAISADMLRVLPIPAVPVTLRSETPSSGKFFVSRDSIAANAFNVTQGKDYQGAEASTTFICSLIFAVDELWAEIVASHDDFFNGGAAHEWYDMRISGRDYSIVDLAVPSIPVRLIHTVLELRPTSISETSVPDGPVSMESLAQAELFELGLSVVHGLLDLLIDNEENAG